MDMSALKNRGPKTEFLLTFPIVSRPGAVKPFVPIGAGVKNVSELPLSDGIPVRPV
jgi:hypothetical protein